MIEYLQVLGIAVATIIAIAAVCVIGFAVVMLWVSVRDIWRD